MAQNRILDELAQTGIDLLLKEPFYAHLFAGLNKEIVPPGHPVDTLAVGKGRYGFTLYVNSHFWDQVLTRPNHRRGVVKHEMLHLVFKHLIAGDQRLDPKLMNIAFDLVVNQYINPDDLPADSIFLSAFPDLKLKPGQTWFYYYKQLEKLQKEADGESNGTPSADMLRNIQSDSHGMERHQPWREIRSQSRTEKSVEDIHLDSLLRTAHQKTQAPAWGAMPGEIRDALDSTLSRPKPALNWRAVLRLFTASASSTKLKNTIRRPSRRYGTSPGIQIKRRQKLLVAIDTSGSLGTDEIADFFQEIFHIWRAGAVIDIVECDTKIYNRYPYRGLTPEIIQGRGGTSLLEPILLANREMPDALIYFTDGYADIPDASPRIPTLWLITPKGINPAHAAWNALPGRKVKM